ncbi:MAG: hypothetical protein NTW86_14355 [Candidatus Sumerlaeota bacterium]|nr:hypothetical protein [Candidatus Sumerlaeota bacterium]
MHPDDACLTGGITGCELTGRMTGVDFSLAAMTDLAIQYDAMGNATKMTGPGTTLSYTYSGTAPTSESYDSGVGFQFANNGAGMRLASQTPAGEEFWNYYDSLGRLTQVWPPRSCQPGRHLLRLRGNPRWQLELAFRPRV